MGHMMDLFPCCLSYRLNFSTMRGLKKILASVLILAILLLIYTAFKTKSNYNINTYFRPRLKAHEFCSASEKTNGSFIDISSSNNVPASYLVRRNPRVLLIPKTSYSKAFQAVSALLNSNRIKYKMSVAGKNLPDLIKISKGMPKYGVIWFEDIRSYLEMDDWNRELLDKYCKKFNVGIIAFVPGFNSRDKFTDLGNSNLRIKTRQSNLKDLHVNGESPIPRIIKSGKTLTGDLVGQDWVTFHPTNTHQFIPVATAKNGEETEVTVIHDTGKNEGIKKIFFGGGITHWIDKLLFLDSLHYLSNYLIRLSLSRFVLVDIDDIFVGKNRMTEDDVRFLIESQNRLRKLIPGFKFNLGFSGSYFHLKGASRNENLGDDYLIQNKDLFWWFPHMWQHIQPHRFDNATELEERMKLNKQFAIDKGLPINSKYSVAPHHSGVYPIHEPLYQAWKKIWNIEVTSTEEYPHLRPAFNRRGFVYQDIQVLPRQTCGLFTKNLYYDEYPNGPKILENSIKGGELFQTVVYNPVSIFMTHMPNYAFDRLSPYTFESVFNMIKCWTNLKVQTVEPEKLGKIYFDLFPDETTPIWGNPCNDRRHKEIWSDKKSCRRLPDFLVIGPQKTGTTALYSFLQLHPSINSNYPSETTFEELQFFSGNDNYIKGIDYYMNYFPFAPNGTFLFEKSATYFDRETVPMRAHRLLPKAHLVAIIISPSKRAYSWYHHMRAHDDSTAINYSFDEVIRADNNSPKALRSLQSRCLEPGKYAQHLDRWLTFYNSQLLHVIDGEELKYDPVSVMNRLQHSLDIRPFRDYSDKLKFDKNKGFYCPVTKSGRVKCLGKGKGRQYPPMRPESQRYLQEYFRLYNEALVKLLKRLGYMIPDWLVEELKDIPQESASKQNRSSILKSKI